MLFGAESTESFVVTFFTTFDALAFQRACHSHGMEGRLTTIPRQLSAGCGMAWVAPIGARDAIEHLIRSEHLECEELHAILL